MNQQNKTMHGDTLKNASMPIPTAGGVRNVRSATRSVRNQVIGNVTPKDIQRIVKPRKKK